MRPTTRSTRRVAGFTRAWGHSGSGVAVRLSPEFEDGRTRGGVREPGPERLHVGVGQPDLEGDGLRVPDVPYVAAGGPQVVLHLARALVVDGDGGEPEAAPGERAHGVQGLADRSAVRRIRPPAPSFTPP